MTQTATSTIDKLVKFVNQRPGLQFCNYGEISSYRSEMREITRDRSDFYELLGLASARIPDLETKVAAFLSASSGRLILNESGELQYCTGQYFPTEYRPAACRVLRDLIWASYRDEKETDSPNNVYNTGDEIRKAIKRRLSRRVARLYFN